MTEKKKAKVLKFNLFIGVLCLVLGVILSIRGEHAYSQIEYVISVLNFVGAFSQFLGIGVEQ